ASKLIKFTPSQELIPDLVSLYPTRSREFPDIPVYTYWITLGKSPQRGLVSAYFWNSDVLAERLAGHILRDAHDRYVEIYKAINELDHHFKD
ncbi:MAG: hypothetical protein ACMX3H_03220, partial [Sodalis sp. (in: enterobacteria)]